MPPAAEQVTGASSSPGHAGRGGLSAATPTHSSTGGDLYAAPPACMQPPDAALLGAGGDSSSAESARPGLVVVAVAGLQQPQQLAAAMPLTLSGSPHAAPAPPLAAGGGAGPIAPAAGSGTEDSGSGPPPQSDLFRGLGQGTQVGHASSPQPLQRLSSGVGSAASLTEQHPTATAATRSPPSSSQPHEWHHRPAQAPWAGRPPPPGTPPQPGATPGGHPHVAVGAVAAGLWGPLEPGEAGPWATAAGRTGGRLTDAGAWLQQADTAAEEGPSNWAAHGRAVPASDIAAAVGVTREAEQQARDRQQPQYRQPSPPGTGTTTLPTVEHQPAWLRAFEGAMSSSQPRGGQGALPPLVAPPAYRGGGPAMTPPSGHSSALRSGSTPSGPSIYPPHLALQAHALPYHEEDAPLELTPYMLAAAALTAGADPANTPGALVPAPGTYLPTAATLGSLAGMTSVAAAPASSSGPTAVGLTAAAPAPAWGYEGRTSLRAGSSSGAGPWSGAPRGQLPTPSLTGTTSVGAGSGGAGVLPPQAWAPAALPHGAAPAPSDTVTTHLQHHQPYELYHRQPRYASYHMARFQANANHMLFYLVDTDFRATLAVVVGAAPA